MIPPGEGYQWAAAYSNQVLLVLCLVLFRSIIGGIEWVLDLMGRLKGPKLSEKAQMMVEMSKSIAQSFNVGNKAGSTGVRFEDVQVSLSHVLFVSQSAICCRDNQLYNWNSNRNDSNLSNAPPDGS